MLCHTHFKESAYVNFTTKKLRRHAAPEVNFVQITPILPQYPIEPVASPSHEWPLSDVTNQSQSTRKSNEGAYDKMTQFFPQYPIEPVAGPSYVWPLSDVTNQARSTRKTIEGAYDKITQTLPQHPIDPVAGPSHELPLSDVTNQAGRNNSQELQTIMLGYSNAGIPDKSWQAPVAVIETTMGSMVVEMYWKHSPITCRNFMELVRRGYYNNTKFHRVIRDFMIQGGDPTGTGKGGQSIYGPQFDDEISLDLKHTGAGVLSMANAGPNSNGSQFFVSLAPTQWLDGKHTIFGRVQSGMAVVKRIGLVECDKNDCPVDDVRIDKAYIPK